MAIKDKVDDLKGRPNEDKKVVAGGVAITIMIILFLTWGFFFIKKLQHNNQNLQFGGTAQDEFNFSNIKQAQADLMKGSNRQDELKEARQESGSRSGTSASPPQDQGSSPDPFGGLGSIE